MDATDPSPRSKTPTIPSSHQQRAARDLNGLREILDTAFQTASDVDDTHNNGERLGKCC